jgi:hypothetical protein
VINWPSSAQPFVFDDGSAGDGAVGDGSSSESNVIIAKLCSGPFGGGVDDGMMNDGAGMGSASTARTVIALSRELCLAREVP